MNKLKYTYACHSIINYCNKRKLIQMAHKVLDGLKQNTNYKKYYNLVSTQIQNNRNWPLVKKSLIHWKITSIDQRKFKKITQF